MKSKIIDVLVILLVCCSFYYYCYAEKKEKSPAISLNLDREKLSNSMRKISFENHMNSATT